MKRLDLALTLYRDLLQQADLLSRPPEQVEATQYLAASYALQGARAFTQERDRFLSEESEATIRRVVQRRDDPAFLKEKM